MTITADEESLWTLIQTSFLEYQSGRMGRLNCIANKFFSYFDGNRSIFNGAGVGIHRADDSDSGSPVIIFSLKYPMARANMVATAFTVLDGNFSGFTYDEVDEIGYIMDTERKMCRKIEYVDGDHDFGQDEYAECTLKSIVDTFFPTDDYEMALKRIVLECL